MKEFDARVFRNACGTFATGVTVITSKNDEQIHGMTANGFMSVSLEPPLIVVSIGNNQKMCEEIKKSGIYGVSILKDEQMQHSDHFAGKPNPNLVIEFEEFEGIPVLKNAHSYFATKVVSTHVEGDHTLFIGEVVDFYNEQDGNPLLFYKGKYKNLIDVTV